ncbi:MAG: hypothetical protein U0270_42420 [Labilithrix sp.]
MSLVASIAAAAGFTALGCDPKPGEPQPPAAPSASASPPMVACQRDAKICPDGVTSVGREGPRCEFAPCPGEKK